MQMKKIFSTLTVIFLLQLNFAFAQETCKVLLEPITGTYTGECSKGKANGNGKSVGTDTYEGVFKNGFPHGEGKYTFKDGHYYLGSFNKGKMDGEGKMFYKTADGQDSIVTGFWKKDNYSGLYEKPFKIHNQPSSVGRIEIFKSGVGNEIIIEMNNMSRGMGAQFSSLNEIGLKAGNYVTKASSRSGNTEITVFKGVTFPFRATFTFGVSKVELEFFEESNYKVIVPVQ